MEDAKFLAVIAIVRWGLRVVSFDIFNETWRPNLVSVVNFVWITFFPCLIAQFTLQHLGGSIVTIGEGVAIFLVGFLSFFTLVEMVANRREWNALMQDVHGRRAMYRSPKISALFDEYYDRNLKICKFLYGVYISTFSYFLLPAILPDPVKYNLPVPAILPYLTPTDRLTYWINFLYQFIAVVIAQHALISQCSALIIGIMSACCQIHAIKLMLDDFNAQINDPNVKPEALEESLSEIIQFHASTKEYIARVKDKYAIVYLAVLFCCGGIVCGCLNVLAEDPLNSANALMGAGCFSMLVHCFFGNTLLIENDTLPDAIYAIDWYKLPIREQKAIRFLLANAQPDTMLHGIFFPLNMGTFISIMKAAFSYYSILSQKKGK